MLRASSLVAVTTRVMSIVAKPRRSMTLRTRLRASPTSSPRRTSRTSVSSGPMAGDGAAALAARDQRGDVRDRGPAAARDRAAGEILRGQRVALGEPPLDEIEAL